MIESSYYPARDGNRNRPYYVEFNCGGRKDEFTLFRRQWLLSEKEVTKMSINDPLGAINGGEVHPWNLFTGEYFQEGCVPDKALISWMVDAMNDKYENAEGDSYQGGV